MSRHTPIRHTPQRTDRTESDSPVGWLDVPAVAQIHASSEAEGFPVVTAFSRARGAGWRAADPGVQVVTVQFRRPQDLRRIRLVFEVEAERTQEFTVMWSSGRGETHREAVRQQFNFSPHGAVREVEEYRVELFAVETLQIRIIPDITGRAAAASLKECQIG